MSKTKKARQGNFFDVCSECKVGFSCCLGTRPPITKARRETIDAYLGANGLQIAHPFIQEEYMFPRETREGYCIFHDPETRKCAVHPVKPETCVAGPITFDINKKTQKIEWHIKLRTICPLAGIVYDDKKKLEQHLLSAKKEITRLVDQLDPTALKAILRKDEPETFKLAEENAKKHHLEKL